MTARWAFNASPMLRDFTTRVKVFTIEHNRGHHRDVATPVDPASSRMGESIYRFVQREMPGALVRAWGLERDRLARGGHGVDGVLCRQR